MTEIDCYENVNIARTLHKKVCIIQISDLITKIKNFKN